MNAISRSRFSATGGKLAFTVILVLVAQILIIPRSANATPTVSWNTTDNSVFSGNGEVNASTPPDLKSLKVHSTSISERFVSGIVTIQVPPLDYELCLTVDGVSDVDSWPSGITVDVNGGSSNWNNCFYPYYSGSSGQISIDTSSWPNGIHSLDVATYDVYLNKTSIFDGSLIVANSPSQTVAIAGNSKVTVSWEPPGGSFGFPSVAYTATATSQNGSTFSCTTSDTGSSCVIRGLTNGVPYQVEVHAADPKGIAPPSPTMAIPLTVNPHTTAQGLSNTISGAAASLAWTSDPPNDNATIQKSSDGTNWTTLGTSATQKFTITGAGLSYYVRVLSSSGASSNVIGITTGGLAQQTVRFVTSTGQPVSGGSVSWAMANGGSRSSIVYGLLSDGTYTFPAAPGGNVNLTLTNAVMPDGAFVSGTFHGVLSSGTVLVIRLPAAPSSAINSVQVVTPSGVPVWGAKVSITNLSSSVTVGDATFVIPSQYSPCTSSYDTYGCSLSNLQADINGTVTFWGYYGGSSDNWNDSETEISVVYDDGVVTQTPPSVVPTSSNTVVTLEYEPYVASISTTVVAPAANMLTGVTITLNAGAAPAFAGIRSHVAGYLANRRVTAVLPAGYRACAGQIVTAVTNARGQAAFKVCATQTGQIKFKTPGVLIPGAVSFFIAGTASQPVRMLHGTTPARGSASLTWVAPSFSGGVPVLSYQITISAPGKKTVTASTTKLQFSVAGLVNATRYTVTVRAVTRLGIGAPAAAVIAVA